MIKVLIYDDNESRQNSLRTLLSFTQNMQCVGAFYDCSNTKNDVEELQPDVVLMDIEMPNVDGLEGVKIIKQYQPHIKVIMQTAFEDNNKIFAALQAGAEGYILKNASVNTIIQSIEEVNNGGAFMTPSVAIKALSFFKKIINKVDEKVEGLSPREKEILILLAEGNSYKMVANKLNISYFTVNNHIKKVYEKLQVHSLGEAIAIAHKEHLL